jgi:hypothetical protein
VGNKKAGVTHGSVRVNSMCQTQGESTSARINWTAVTCRALRAIHRYIDRPVFQLPGQRTLNLPAGVTMRSAPSPEPDGEAPPELS